MKKTVLTIGVMALVAIGLTSCGGGDKSHNAKPADTEHHDDHGHSHDAHEGHDHGSHEGHDH